MIRPLLPVIACAIFAALSVGAVEPPASGLDTRAGVVARPVPAGVPVAERPRLTVLTGDIPQNVAARVAAGAPNLDLKTGLTRQTALEHAAEADAVDARLLSPELLARAPHLAWAHSLSAGVDRLLAIDGVRESELVLTNSRAAHGPAIADHVMAMLLTFTRNLHQYDESQRRAEWSRREPERPSVALQDRTMLVVGLGGIGTEVARRAHAFGMHVIATRRSQTPSPDFVERTGRSGDLPEMLPAADVVVLCVPLTPETENLIDAEAFKAMKPGAILINIARGKVIDTAALVAALESGRLAAAGLDVTDPEPLPADHPLWKSPNVIITPHVASDAELTEERLWAIFEQNLLHFAAGEPLINVVDKAAGY